MTTDQLHERLRDEFGDPEAAAPPGAGDWAEVAAGHARWRVRRQAGLALGAAAVVGLAVLAASTLGHSGSTTVRVAIGAHAPTTAQTQTQAPIAPSPAPSDPLATGVPTSAYTGSLPSPPPTVVSPPVTTVPLGAPVPAPTTGPVSPPGQLDCGTAYLASGWPTTTVPSPTVQQCILDAFASGQPAIYRERAQTDGNGGHIEITTYEVTGVRQVRRTVDATGAQPPGGVTVSACTGLTNGGDGQLAASGCTAG